MFKIYHAPGTVALASLIVLEEVGAKYEALRLDFSRAEQQQADYTAINKKARVPSLMTEDGVLTETPAILVYLAQEFNQSELALPQSSFEFARLQSFNSYLCSTLHVAHAHRMRGHRWTDDAAAQAALTNYVPVSMAEIWQYVETQLLNDDSWAMGSSYSIADPYLFTVAQWMEGDSINPQDYPRLYAHRQKMAERAAVKRALAVEAS